MGVWADLFLAEPACNVGFEQCADGGLVHIIRGDGIGAGIDAFFDWFAAEVGDHGFDAEVAHIHGVLEDEAVEFLIFEGFDEGAGAIEADEFDLAGAAAVLEGAEHAEGGGFIGGEDTVYGE